VFRQGRIICNRLTSQTNPQEIVGLITGAIDPATLAPEYSKNAEKNQEETV
jgi:fructose transport system ATP-binding protein